MKTLALVISLTAVLLPAAPAGAESSRWIHVRVDEDGERGARVDVQVPLSMVSALLPSLKSKIEVHDGRLDFGDDEMSLAELRGYWTAVKAAKDGNYVTIRDGEDTVRIAKRGGIVHVDVSENRGSERVKVRLPVPLVDAFLAGDDTIEVDQLVKALSNVPNGEIVAVDDDESRVRIWIDDKPEPSREDAP